MNLSILLATLDEIAPLKRAESWDNVGLLIGDPNQAVSNVMLTIDYTPEVAAEAIAAKCNLVIAYHPPLFKPINRMTAGATTDLLWGAARRGIAIYSPHTAWDAADGGANDFLANVLMLKDVKSLRVASPAQTHCKLVTFVPLAQADRVAAALFAAGAGSFGNYSECSFRVAGQGTFRGNEHSSPAVGEPGRSEIVEEVRLESIVPLERIDSIVAALKRSHPYEMPAYDLLSLVGIPSAHGTGRIGKLPGQLTGDMLINHVKHDLGLKQMLVAGPTDKLIVTAGCCAGAGGDLLGDAIAQNADFYLTGELRHHDALAAAAKGMVVACTLHTNSERASLTWLRERILTAHPELKILQSEKDRDPFAIV